MAEPLPELTAGSALQIAAEVASVFSWPTRQARVLGPVGKNAAVLLTERQLVLRISSIHERDRAARELAVSRWLRTRGVPAVQAAEELTTPFEHDGAWVITGWEYIPGVLPASTETIGTVLKRIHQLQAPSDLDLPHLDPFHGISDYIGQATLEPRETDFLLRRLGELQDAYAHVDFVLPLGPVHGDAHRKNIVQGGDGHPVVLDLEEFSTGAREWDLVVAAVYERLGWYTPGEYEAFASAYGWDIRTWSGFETMASVRELRMTAWLCARTGREPRLLPEARRRVASLRAPSAVRQWQPGA